MAEHLGLAIPRDLVDNPNLNPVPLNVSRINYQRKPAIRISHIHPPTSKAKDARAPLFRGHEFVLYSSYIQTVESNPRNHFDERQSIHCDVDRIVYNELAERSSVTGLIFHLIGHDFLTKSIQHDFSCYASTVHDIEFNGHFSYIAPAFQIMSQLTSLRSVTFVLGKQLPFYLEDDDEEYANFSVPPNSAYSLCVKVEPVAYHRGGESNKVVIHRLIDAVFRRVGQCMPKLAHLNLKLPSVDETFLVYEKILHNCRGVEGETFITFEITSLDNMVSCQCIILAEEEESSSNILTDNIVPFPDLSESDNYQRDKDLFEAYEKLKKAFKFLETIATVANSSRRIQLPQEPLEVFIPPAPPGFDHLYDRIRIASIQTTSSSRQQSPRTEMEQVFININRNQEAVERNQRRLRLNRLIEGYEQSASFENPLGFGANHEPVLTRAFLHSFIVWYREMS